MTAPADEDSTASDREIVLTRVVDAPRALVWKVWTDSAHVPQWWGPTGFTTTTQEMDLRPGGRWRFVMRGPDGREYPNLITYQEIVEGTRLVYEHGGEAGAEPVHFRVHVTFEDADASGRRTRVTLRSIFPSSKARDFVVREYNALEGGKQHLARMAEHVAALAQPAGAMREFVVQRALSAPRDLVYRVWTEREHLARWFGPKGCTIPVCDLDLRPGGSFHYCMRFPGGQEMWGKWAFREVVRGERLVFESSFSDAAGAIVRAPFSTLWPLRTLSTVTFEQHAGKGGGTVVTVRGIPLDASEAERRTFDEGHASMRQGWAGTFEQLAGHVAML